MEEVGFLRRAWRRARIAWRARSAVRRVVLGPDGFELRWEARGARRPVRVEAVAWDSVVSILAFKVDRWTVDEIRLAFELRDGRRVEISEECGGYPELVRELPERLVGCAAFEDWWPKVAFPAFEANLTVVFGRPA